jgi:hypothetical protein
MDPRDDLPSQRMKQDAEVATVDSQKGVDIGKVLGRRPYLRYDVERQ